MSMNKEKQNILKEAN